MEKGTWWLVEEEHGHCSQIEDANIPYKADGWEERTEKNTKPGTLVKSLMPWGGGGGGVVISGLTGLLLVHRPASKHSLESQTLCLQSIVSKNTTGSHHYTMILSRALYFAHLRK